MINIRLHKFDPSEDLLDLLNANIVKSKQFKEGVSGWYENFWPVYTIGAHPTFIYRSVLRAQGKAVSMTSCQLEKKGTVCSSCEFLKFFRIRQWPAHNCWWGQTDGERPPCVTENLNEEKRRPGKVNFNLFYSNWVPRRNLLILTNIINVQCSNKWIIISSQTLPPDSFIVHLFSYYC